MQRARNRRTGRKPKVENPLSPPLRITVFWLSGISTHHVFYLRTPLADEWCSQQQQQQGCITSSSRSHHGKSWVEVSGSIHGLPRDSESVAHGGAMRVSAPQRTASDWCGVVQTFHDSRDGGVCARVFPLPKEEVESGSDVCCPILVSVMCAQHASVLKSFLRCSLSSSPPLGIGCLAFGGFLLFGLARLDALRSRCALLSRRCVGFACSWCAAAEADPRHQGLPAEGSPVS